MQIKLTTLLVAPLSIATITEAAPAATTAEDISLNPVTTENIGLAKRAGDHCRGSTFENRGSDASPLISDCQRLANNLSGNGSFKYTSHDRHKTIASYGS
ncbi:hypothetical protein QBC36DRAFT_292779 [Triangularia setosa]|uniref:Ecp2 effector protein-like domain-containing protein n=1 Tax=Triangularia setosa TaxID=2587417 RepID=A0AAN7A6G0_9PEZI|nr:hypothetical protein QBC36DRAFT_292779 [Podospora setosa]